MKWMALNEGEGRNALGTIHIRHPQFFGSWDPITPSHCHTQWTYQYSCLLLVYYLPPPTHSRRYKLVVPFSGSLPRHYAWLYCPQLNKLGAQIATDTPRWDPLSAMSRGRTLYTEGCNIYRNSTSQKRIGWVNLPSEADEGWWNLCWLTFMHWVWEIF